MDWLQAIFSYSRKALNCRKKDKVSQRQETEDPDALDLPSDLAGK